MGWSIGFDSNWNRDIGYGVPCLCDFPKCKKKIDRGLSYVCGGEPYGGEYGCGLYFCNEHQVSIHQTCEKCSKDKEPFKPKEDIKEWILWKLTDSSWKEWRKENKEFVRKYRKKYKL